MVFLNSCLNQHLTILGQTEFPFRTTTSTRSPTTIQATTSSRGTTTRSQPTTTPQTPTTITTTTTTSRTTSKSRANSPTGPPKTTTTIANKAVKRKNYVVWYFINDGKFMLYARFYQSNPNASQYYQF